MWFHFVIIGGLLLLAVLMFINGETKFKRKAYLAIVFILLFFISAFRSINIGNDTATYVKMFDIFGSANNIFDLDTRIEIGYIIFNKILYHMTSNPLILFIVTSAFILGSYLKFIYKNSNMIWLSVLLLINLRLFYFTLSGIRQSIAIAIVLLGYEYIKSRKLIKFIIVILIASLFHYSAIVFLIVYPISKIKFSYLVVILQAIIGVALYFAFDILINFAFRLFPQYQAYTASGYFDGNVRIASILNFFVILSILLLGLFTKLGKHKLPANETNRVYNANLDLYYLNEDNLLLHIISLGVISYFIAINASLLDRVAMYFFIFTIILVPKAISNIRNRKMLTLVTYLIVVLTFVYNITILLYRPEWQHVYPYEFFWQL